MRRATEFEVWGCRGSRSLAPPRSALGNYTSCYSLAHGEEIYVLDAGRGLAVLGYELTRRPAYRKVRRVHLLVSHAHMDHWEGLKDAEWFWRKGSGLEVAVYGSAQVLEALATAFAHPLYVSLDLLAAATVGRVRTVAVTPGEDWVREGWRVRTRPLNHYSGDQRARQWLDTLGFHVTAPDGAAVAYLCDHEPSAATRAVECDLLSGARMAVCDAHWLDASEHAHGHGSIEHAARLAREHPHTLVLAGHHGPGRSDAEIRAGCRRHAAGLRNLALAVEGRAWAWDGTAFRRRP